jgi:hypothetical protein
MGINIGRIKMEDKMKREPTQSGKGKMKTNKFKTTRLKTEVTKSIWVNGLGFNEQSGEAVVFLKYKRLDGIVDGFAISPADLRGRKTLIAALVNKGCRIPRDPKKEAGLVERLCDEADRLRNQPQKIMKLSDRTGWTRDGYYLTPKRVIPEDGNIQYEGEVKDNIAVFETSGTLEGWQRDVGEKARCSTRLMFGCGVVLAAPLLRFAKSLMGNFGINIFGPSSNGKTSLQQIAASLVGPCVLYPFNSSPAGREQLALGHCDTVLLHDDLKALRGTPRQRAEIVRESTYYYAHGRTEAKDAGYRRREHRPGGEFRLTWLCTNEAAYSIDRTSGERVRLIDLPAVSSGSFGIIDRFPRGTSGTEAAAALINDMRAAGEKHSGHVFPAFISKIQSETKNKLQFQAHIRREVNAAIDEWGAEAKGSPGGRRFAAPFALSLVAGLRAIQWGLLPWTSEEFRTAVKQCWQDALAVSPGLYDKAATVVEICRWVTEEATIANWDGNDRMKNLVFLRKAPKTTYLVPSDVLRRQFMDRTATTAALRLMKTEGGLATDKGRNVLTTQIWVDEHRRRSFYEIDAKYAKQKAKAEDVTFDASRPASFKAKIRTPRPKKETKITGGLRSDKERHPRVVTPRSRLPHKEKEKQH